MAAPITACASRSRSSSGSLGAVLALLASWRFIRSSPGMADGLDGGGVFERGEVAGVGAEVGGADDAAHDFGVARLGEVGDELHRLGLEVAAEALDDGGLDLGAEGLAGLLV